MMKKRPRFTDVDTDDPNLGKPETSTVIQFGLELPNGKVLWDGYQNYQFVNEDQRAHMLAVLRKTSEQCGFVEDEFLQSYNWHRRQVTTTVRHYTGTLPVDSPVATGRQDTSDDDNDGSAGDQNGDPGNGTGDG